MFAGSAIHSVPGELVRTLQNRLIIDDLPTPPFPMMITLISAADVHARFVSRRARVLSWQWCGPRRLWLRAHEAASVAEQRSGWQARACRGGRTLEILHLHPGYRCCRPGTPSSPRGPAVPNAVS